MQGDRGEYYIEVPRPLVSKILLCISQHQLQGGQWTHLLRSGCGNSSMVTGLPRPARKFLRKITLGLVIPDPAQVLCPCNRVELALM